jgi:hypothetical protein
MTGTRPIRYLTAAAPWCTLAMLVALATWLPNRVTLDAATDERQIEIASAMKDVPLFIGDWVGRDWEVPPEAQELLRPNAILSRQYQRPGEANLHVLVVHCSDARDMIGHYPPVCYPAAGWVRDRSPELVVTLSAEGHRLPARTYLFHRTRENGVEESIRIFNAFVLPDGTVTPDIGDINRQSERLAVSVQGVAQLQVISAADSEFAEAVLDGSELLDGMSGLLGALGIGARSDA